jgi:hypothetical protein
VRVRALLTAGPRARGRLVKVTAQIPVFFTGSSVPSFFRQFSLRNSFIIKNAPKPFIVSSKGSFH